MMPFTLLTRAPFKCVRALIDGIDARRGVIRKGSTELLRSLIGE